MATQPRIARRHLPVVLLVLSALLASALPLGPKGPKSAAAATAPTITTFQFTSMTPTEARLYFTTDELAQGYVDYGLTTNLGRVRPTAPSPEALERTVVLDSLKPDTRYYYRARATNAFGEDTTTTSSFRTPTATATARLSVTSTNSDKSLIVPGACFDVFTDTGGGALGAFVAEYCDRYDGTPNNGKVLFPALNPGAYVLLEIRSPDGYALAPKWRFSVAAGQTLRRTVTHIQGGAALTIETRDEVGQLLAGACFWVYRAAGGVAGELVAFGCDDYDGNDGLTPLGSLRSGTYRVVQRYVPQGYVAADGQTLTVESGQLKASLSFTSYSEASGDTIELQAIDAEGRLLPGACFLLTSDTAASRAVCDWSDGRTDGRTFFANAAPASYTALEFHAPPGYQVGKRTTFTKVDNAFRRLRFTQVAGGVRVTAKTFKGSTSSILPGACYGLFRQVSSGPWPAVAFWCDGDDGVADGLTRLDGVRSGTYGLVQTVTPSGYARPRDQIVAVGSTSKTVTVRTFTSSSLGASAASLSDPYPLFIDPPVAEPTSSPSATPTRMSTPVSTTTPTPIPTETVAPVATETPMPIATESATPMPTETVAPAPSVTPIPNASPVAEGGPDQTLTDSDGDGAEGVTLDGGASSDPDGDQLSYVWRIGDQEVGQGSMVTTALPVGAHTILLQVSDPSGATATDEITITISAQPVEAEPTAVPTQAVTT